MSMVLSKEDIATLHGEAVAVSRAAALFGAQREMDETFAFIDKVREEQLRLTESILKTMETVVVSAAAGGFTNAQILEFKGGELFDTYSLLFLLLGGHDQERRRELESYGFEPLIGKLRALLKPFDLVHDWDRETNWNRLIVTW